MIRDFECKESETRIFEIIDDILSLVSFQFRLQATNSLLLLNDTINDRNDLFVDVNAAHSCSWNDRNEDESKKKDREKTKKYEKEKKNLDRRLQVDAKDIEHFVW